MFWLSTVRNEPSKKECNIVWCPRWEKNATTESTRWTSENSQESEQIRHFDFFSVIFGNKKVGFPSPFWSSRLSSSPWFFLELRSPRHKDHTKNYTVSDEIHLKNTTQTSKEAFFIPLTLGLGLLSIAALKSWSLTCSWLVFLKKISAIFFYMEIRFCHQSYFSFQESLNKTLLLTAR